MTEKNWKMLPGLMSFCSDISMEGPEFGVNDTEAWIHPALSKQFSLLLVVSWCWGYFLGTFWTH